MDDRPPPYEGKYSDESGTRKKSDTDSEKRPWSLNDQVKVSRSWLVSTAAERIHEALRQRAFSGISKTTMILVPSGQECDLSGDWDIVEFDNKPIKVELTGESSGVEFWSQEGVVEELRRQIVSRIGDERIMAQINQDELHVRHETPFGVIETTRIVAIVVYIQ